MGIAENRAAARQAKLDAIQLQIARGTLTVRQMTAEERKLNPPHPATPLRKRWIYATTGVTAPELSPRPAGARGAYRRPKPYQS